MAVCYGLALNTMLSAELCSSGEIDLYSGLVIVGQPQFSTMTEGRHNQWAP